MNFRNVHHVLQLERAVQASTIIGEQIATTAAALIFFIDSFTISNYDVVEVK